MKKLRIAWINQHEHYEFSLPIRILCQMLGKRVEFTQPENSDLLFVGPFHQKKKSRRKKWIRKHLSSKGLFYEQILEKRTDRPLTVYHTGENTRHDATPADYSISMDLSVQSETHYRLPYWHCTLDWSEDGLPNVKSLTFGSPIQPEVLLRPLDKCFIQKPRKAALICMHLREPRRSLLEALKQVMPVDGYGGAFSKEIKHHNKSGFTKSEILENYGFSLCPENSLYLGYYTEKIPEAFACASLPISWCDQHVAHDFNPDAFLNMHQFAAQGYAAVMDAMLSEERLKDYTTKPLLSQKPSLDGLRSFLETIVANLD